MAYADDVSMRKKENIEKINSTFIEALMRSQTSKTISRRAKNLKDRHRAHNDICM